MPSIRLNDWGSTAKLGFMMPLTLISYTQNKDVNFIEINAGDQNGVNCTFDEFTFCVTETVYSCTLLQLLGACKCFLVAADLTEISYWMSWSFL